MTTEATIFPNNTNLFDINENYKELEKKVWEPKQFPTEDPQIVDHLEKMHPSEWEAYLNSKKPNPTTDGEDTITTEDMEMEDLALDQPTADAVHRDQWLAEELNAATSEAPEDTYQLNTRTTRSKRLSKPPARYTDY